MAVGKVGVYFENGPVDSRMVSLAVHLSDSRYAVHT